MAKLYLITGFLGCGKTTFLKNFIQEMKNYKLSIIVNEFGKEGIDGKLLADIGVSIAEVNNGSIFCSCKIDQFEEVLSENIKQNPDVIIVEASGLSDPTNIAKILTQNDKFSQIEYMGSICIVDAINFNKVYSTARACKKQISMSDIILINKIDIASAEQVEEIKNIIASQYPHAVIYKTSFGKIKPEWIQSIKNRILAAEVPKFQTKDVGLQKFLITINDNMTYLTLEKFIRMFIEDTYRIKGFVKLEGKLYFVDCVGPSFKAAQFEGPVGNCNKLVALSGAGMPLQKSIDKATLYYKEYVTRVE